jgi:hypothetical protein
MWKERFKIILEKWDIVVVKGKAVEIDVMKAYGSSDV